MDARPSQEARFRWDFETRETSRIVGESRKTLVMRRSSGATPQDHPSQVLTTCGTVRQVDDMV